MILQENDEKISLDSYNNNIQMSFQLDVVNASLCRLLLLKQMLALPAPTTVPSRHFSDTVYINCHLIVSFRIEELVQFCRCSSFYKIASLFAMVNIFRMTAI